MRLTRTPRFLVIGSAVVGLGAAALAVPQATAAPAAPAAAPAVVAAEVPTPPDIVWGACENPRLVSAGAECGDVEVPLDYADPEGETITIAVSRIQHTGSDADYQGPILFNPGGPGGSGLIYSIFARNGAFPAKVTSDYDFIGFDPRGVGESEPAVRCRAGYTAPVRPRYTPRPGPRGSEDVRAWMRKTNAYTTKCAQKNGDILDHLTTKDNARDMESIRLALAAEGTGEDRLNYYGFSYGTYLGQVYGTLFPDNVRRMVFDGTVDPRDIWYDANLNQDIAFETTANKWFRWISQHDDAYALGTTKQEVRDTYFDIQRKLDREPVGPEGEQIGGAEWSDTFLYAGYYDSFYPELAQVFSDYVNEDDVAAVRDEYLALNGPGDDNGYAVYLGTECTDTTTWPQSWGTWKKDNERIAARHPFLTWGNAWFNEPCRHWPGATHREVTVDGSGVDSLLMINEEFDAATPLPGSYEVRKRFPGARLIQVDGGTTHSNSLAGNRCVDQRIFDYLADDVLPRRESGPGPDVTCQMLPHPEPDESTALTQFQKLAPLELMH